MRIAMIGSRGIGSNYGGIERVLDQLCPQLADLGHSVDVFSQSNVRFAGYDRVRAISTRSIGGKHLDNLSRSVVALSRAIRRYDIIHFHAVGPGILSALTRVTGQRSVVTVHGLDYKRDKWGTFARLCLGLAERTLIGNADRVTVVSENLRNYFIERYDTATSFIPNGKPRLERVSPGAFLAAHGLKPSRYILFASRLTPEKGCDDLIVAFNQLIQTSEVPPDMQLVIAGGTGSPEYIASLQAMATSHRICFVGHVTGNDLAELFSNAYAFILPSYIEGMSMALLEAVAYGLPTLVSDIPENRAVVGDCGLSFKPRDINDLAVSLARLMSQPSVATVLAERVSRLNCPDWKTVAQVYDQLYRSAVQPRGEFPIEASQ